MEELFELRDLLLAENIDDAFLKKLWWTVSSRMVGYDGWLCSFYNLDDSRLTHPKLIH